METVERAKCKCSRCGWEWIALTEQAPKRCANPDCRSPYWDSFPTVYVMRNYPKPGSFKIGCTANEKRRYGAAKMRNDIILRIRCSDNIFTLEASIHELFAHKRAAPPPAEAFALDDADLKLLREIAKSDDPEGFVKARLDAPKQA